MPGTNISLKKMLNVYVLFPAVYLYITIFKVIEDKLRESIAGFLYKIWNILIHRNARRACTRFLGKYWSVSIEVFEDLHNFNS